MSTSGHQTSAYALFKGCTRPPLVLGVPLIPLMIMLMSVAAMAMLFGLWWWIAALPSWLVMAQLIKVDDKAFRIFGLWFETRIRNHHHLFWGAYSYTPTAYRRRK